MAMVARLHLNAKRTILLAQCTDKGKSPVATLPGSRVAADPSGRARPRPDAWLWEVRGSSAQDLPEPRAA